MNQQQKNRYDKLRTERFYLLRHDINEKGDLQYHISGSTRNVYTVTVYTTDAKIFCTCPDAKSWASRYNCICKHSLFILYRVLKVFDQLDHPFFDRLWFTPSELECIQLSNEYLQAHLDNTVINDDLTHRFESLCTDTTTTIKPRTDDLCGVCFLEMENDSDEQYLTCPKCKKSAHQDCIQKWVSSGQKLCVYCRQDVWSNLSRGSISEYKNLGF